MSKNPSPVNKVATDIIEDMKANALAHASTNPWDILHPHVPLLRDVEAILKNNSLADQKEIVLKLNAFSEAAVATSQVFEKAYSNINSTEREL